MNNNFKNRGKRAGLDPTISAREIDKIAALSAIKNLNIEYASKEALDIINQGSLMSNPISKASKKTIKYLSGELNNVYFGNKNLNGWISERNFETGLIKWEVTTVKGEKRTNLPYSRTNRTGIYIEAIWSGYNDYFDNENYVLGGYIDSRSIEKTQEAKTKSPFPYKNFNDFFNHSGIQSGDIGNEAFLKGISYDQGLPIKHNKIFFMSGLNRQNMLDYENNPSIPPTKILLLINKGPRDGRRYLDETFGTLARKDEAYIEAGDLETSRYNIFLYTGNLNIKYVQSSPLVRNFGFGPTKNLGIPKEKYILQANNSFSINFTGVYPEVGRKNFTIFNQGNIQEFFYVIPDNGLVLYTKSARTALDRSIDLMNFNLGFNIPRTILDSDVLMDKTIIYNDSLNHKLNGNLFNENIYMLGRNDSSINFTVKIDSADIAPQPGQYTRYINVYRIAGFNSINSQTGNFMTVGYRIPVNLNLLDNNSKVTMDTAFFNYDSNNNYTFSYKVGQPMELNISGVRGLNTNTIGLTLYSTGENLNHSSVKNEIEKRTLRYAP